MEKKYTIKARKILGKKRFSWYSRLSRESSPRLFNFYGYDIFWSFSHEHCPILTFMEEKREVHYITSFQFKFSLFSIKIYIKYILLIYEVILDFKTLFLFKNLIVKIVHCKYKNIGWSSFWKIGFFWLLGFLKFWG